MLVPEKSHAELGPSGWGTWSACPGSIPLARGIPRTSSKYADEGTAAHQLLETCLLEDRNAEDFIGTVYEVNGGFYTVENEMADAVNSTIDIAKNLVGDGILMAEQSVPIQFLTGEQDAEGTSDIIGIADGGKELIVGDLKYGKGVTVYASEKDGRPNGQLAIYALGTLEKFGFLYEDIERVRLVILQPRVEHHDEHLMTVDALRAFGQEVSIAAGRVQINAHAHDNGQELDLNPGEKQCRFCNAKSVCPALRGAVSNALATVSSVDDFEDLSLPKRAAAVTIDDGVTAEKLAEFMRAVSLIEEAIKAARGEVERRLFAGQPVPGYYLGEGKKGNRAWTDEKTALDELTKSGRLKVAEATTAKIISPTAAEKLLKERPKIWAKIAPLIGQAEGKPSVCRDGDRNPLYIPPSAAPADFDDLSVGAAPTLEQLFD